MSVLKSKDIKKFREEWLKLNDVDCITGAKIEKPVLDHDHSLGNVRSVLDYNSNQFLGKIETAWKRFGYKFKKEDLPRVLRSIALYLERDYKNNPLHPRFVSLGIKKFGRMKSVDQITVLLGVGFTEEDIPKTSKERTKLYKKWIMSEKHIYKFYV